MGNDSTFFSNLDCEYFPCHPWRAGEPFNCLFCYCPLYHLDCGRNTAPLAGGRKDCSGCSFPHRRENYDEIIKRLSKNR